MYFYVDIASFSELELDGIGYILYEGNDSNFGTGVTYMIVETD